MNCIRSPNQTNSSIHRQIGRSIWMHSFILIPSRFLLAFIPQFAFAISNHVHCTLYIPKFNCWLHAIYHCLVPCLKLSMLMFECIHEWIPQLNLNIYYVQWHRDASLHRIVYCTFARMPSSIQITKSSFLFNSNLNSKHRCAQYMHHIPNTHRMYTYFITIEYIYICIYQCADVSV